MAGTTFESPLTVLFVPRVASDIMLLYTLFVTDTKNTCQNTAGSNVGGMKTFAIPMFEDQLVANALL